jgi:hypothetical protein
MSSRTSDKANYTKVSGTRRLVRRMELEFNFGLMALSMRACGNRTRPVEKEE